MGRPIVSAARRVDSASAESPLDRQNVPRSDQAGAPQPPIRRLGSKDTPLLKTTASLGLGAQAARGRD